MLLALGAAWLAGVSAIVLAYQRELRRLWREPVFKVPVLVLESDDWGAGPLVQAAALDAMAAVLARHADATGRAPVISLAVVLACPDRRAIAADGGYRRIELDALAFAPVLSALGRGEAGGVFALQLHGLEHYWPAALMASEDAAVKSWLRGEDKSAGGGIAVTEELPAWLQSRWVDARQLPSAPLEAGAIAQAVADEVRTFARVFGRAPTVVVPPTFVWTPEVERAWAANGIGCVVTPGRRYVARAADGSSRSDHARFANGDRDGAITYTVRSDYFEPIKGRDAAYALRGMHTAVAEGRACVLENHRNNFCVSEAARADSLRELERLLSGALKELPGLRFLSSAELQQVLSRRDEQWLVSARRERLSRWWRRLAGTGRLWRLLRLAGVAPLVQLIARPRPAGQAAAHG